MIKQLVKKALFHSKLSQTFVRKKRDYDALCLAQQLQHFPKQQLRFTILIPSFNNAPFAFACLHSALSQRYDNFSIHYLDDHSTDHSLQHIAHIEDPKLHIHQNPKRLGTLHNLSQALHALEPDTIAVILDGDDFLAHPNVLQILNKAYQSQPTDLTYGQYITYPDFLPGTCHPINPHTIRSSPFLTTHLKTFRASLFQAIDPQDLQHDGAFFSSATDYAMMLPMLEMAQHKAQFIPHTLYIQNQSNPLSHHRIAQDMQEYHVAEVRKKTPYLNTRPPASHLSRSL